MRIKFQSPIIIKRKGLHWPDIEEAFFKERIDMSNRAFTAFCRLHMVGKLSYRLDTLTDRERLVIAGLPRIGVKTFDELDSVIAKLT